MLHRGRDILPFVAALLQLSSDFGRDIARPSLGGVEGDDAHRMAVHFVQEVADQHLAIRTLIIIGLAPSAAYPGAAGVQWYEVHVMVRILRHHRWRAIHTG